MRDLPGAVGVVEDEGGVDGPAAGGPREAVERCEAHGGVEGEAVFDRASGRSGSEVEDDEVEGVARALEVLGDGT